MSNGKLLLIEVMNSERVCCECRERFHVGKNKRSLTIRTLDPDGYFCTTRCAAQYGLTMVKVHRTEPRRS